MTVNTPDTGLRARLRRLSRTAAVGVLVVSICGAGVPAIAADGDEAIADAGSVELHLSAGVHGRVAPGAATTASVSVHNGIDASLSTGRITVELNRTPLADSAAVGAWLTDGDAPGDFTEIGAEDTDAVDAEDDDITAIAIPATALADLAPGVYPLRAELEGATTGTSADERIEHDTKTPSVLVVSATQPQVGVIVPLTATPADRVLLTAEELADLTDTDGALTEALDGVTGTSAILAIDPAVLASIRVLGTAAPASASDWLERLDDLPNDRFALQFGDADATVQAQASLPQLLAPTTLQPFLAPENFPTTPATPTPAATDGTASPTPAPTADADRDAPILPSDDELLRIEGAVDGILWPRPGARAEDLALFATYVGDDVTTIVGSSAVGGTHAAHATSDARDLLVIDDAVSAAISSAADESDADVRQGLLAAASAELYFSAQTSPESPLLVGLDRDETRDADALRETIVSVDSIGFDLSSVRKSPAVAVSLAPAERDETRVNALSSFLVDEGALGNFATILDDPQVLLSRERIRVMRDLAVSVSDADFPVIVEAHRTATNETLRAVSIPPSSTIQLLSASADLPFSVKNDLPWPVTLRLSVAPTDPRLDVQRNIEGIVVQPGTSARVKVPVSARVGSGELDLRLNLFSPTGVPIDGPQTVRVAVRAEWETIGLVIFGSLAVLLIVGGVVRTVMRRRREADAEADTETISEAGEKETT